VEDVFYWEIFLFLYLRIRSKFMDRYGIELEEPQLENAFRYHNGWYRNGGTNVFSVVSSDAEGDEEVEKVDDQVQVIRESGAPSDRTYLVPKVSGSPTRVPTTDVSTWRRLKKGFAAGGLIPYGYFAVNGIINGVSAAEIRALSCVYDYGVTEGRHPMFTDDDGVVRECPDVFKVFDHDYDESLVSASECQGFVRDNMDEGGPPTESERSDVQ
jgi:hypothetical protein